MIPDPSTIRLLLGLKGTFRAARTELAMFRVSVSQEGVAVLKAARGELANNGGDRPLPRR